MPQTELTYHLESLQVEQNHGELDNLVDVVRRIRILTGRLKVYYAEIVKVVRIGFMLILELPRGTRVTCNAF